MRKLSSLFNRRTLKVFFYCDLSRQSGFGHFRRLAFYVDHIRASLNATCVFLVRPSEEFLFAKQFIRRELGLPVIKVKEHRKSFWKELGDANLLFIDSYTFTPLDLERWRRKINKPTIVLIDDLERKFPSADIIISPNVQGGKNHPAVERCASQFILRGERYFVLDRRYILAHKKHREIRCKVKNVLVSVGGNPPVNLLRTFVNGLVRSGGGDLCFRIMLGLHGSSVLRSLKRQFPSARRCLFLQKASTVKQLLWADIAIISGGITKYEAAAVGTPSLIVTQSRAQVPFVRLFSRKKTALFFGMPSQVCRKSIRREFERIRNYSFRNRLSKQSKQLIDGRGFERVWPFIQVQLFKNDEARRI